jgi:peptidoglycan/LPS O-acetylase OafA/YrhL
VTAQAAPRSDSGQKSSAFYIPSLDGLRAVAVMIVFAAHAGLNVPIPGNFGVTIFFFLSGYLITTLARREFEQTGGLNLPHFYLRRVLRILPPFYLVLAGATALCLLGAVEGTVRPDFFLAQALHLSNYSIVTDGWWTGRAPGTWVYWSLAVEEHFYLIFPAVYLALLYRFRERRHQALALAAVCVAALAWRCFLVYGLDAPKDRTYVATDTRLDSILFGCILAVYGNPMLDPTRIARRWWTGLLLPLGLAAIAISFAVRDEHFQETFRYTLQGLGLFPIFVAAVRYPDWAPFRVLNIGWVRFLGLLSYSFYLVHTTALFAVHEWTPWPVPLQAGAALAVTLLISLAIYRFVEVPSARLRKRLSGPSVQRGRAATVPQPVAALTLPATAPAPQPVEAH